MQRLKYIPPIRVIGLILTLYAAQTFIQENS